MSLFFILEHKRGNPYTKNRITKPEIEGVNSLIDRKQRKLRGIFWNLKEGIWNLKEGIWNLKEGKPIQKSAL